MFFRILLVLPLRIPALQVKKKTNQRFPPFEYKFGYWPKKGEYLLDIQYKLPLNDPPVFSTAYFYDNSVNMYSFDLNTMFSPFYNVRDFITGVHPDPRKGVLYNYDAKMIFSTGYFDNVCLFDIFSMRTVKVRLRELQTEADSTENDFIFANQFGVAVGNPSRNFFTFMFGFFGETIFIDNGREPSNILLSFLYTASI